MKFFFHDGHQDVNAHGDPDLRFHGVVARAVESFDPQVLFDPAEEQLDLPALGVERGDGRGGKLEMVGEENEGAVVGRVVEFDAPQFGGIISARGGTRRAHGLVAAHAGGEVDGTRVEPGEFHAFFGASDKEGAGLGDAVEPREIQITAIHDIECARLENQQVEPVDLVNVSGRDIDFGGDRSAQIEQGVDLDRRLGRAKARPGKHAQAKIDRRGVEGINGLVQLDAKGIVRVKTAGFGDEMPGQVGVHLPGPMLVGVGQRAARHRAANPQSIKLAAARAQTNFDVPQTLPVSQLGEGQAEKLIPTGEALHLVVAAMTRHDPAKRVVGNPLGELGKNHFGRRHSRWLYPRLPDRVHPAFAAGSSS